LFQGIFAPTEIDFIDAFLFKNQSVQAPAASYGVFFCLAIKQQQRLSRCLLSGASSLIVVVWCGKYKCFKGLVASQPHSGQKNDRICFRNGMAFSQRRLSCNIHLTFGPWARHKNGPV
jgi:hypothetical protein